MSECVVFQNVRLAGISRQRIEKIVGALLRRLNNSRGIVGIHLVGSDRMRRLNHVSRGIDRATDVLSFPINDRGRTAAFQTDELGDVFLCLSVIQNQAKRFGVSVQEELVRMLTHGMLHLLGHDHATQREANVMFHLQEQCVSDVS